MQRNGEDVESCVNGDEKTLGGFADGPDSGIMHMRKGYRGSGIEQAGGTAERCLYHQFEPEAAEGGGKPPPPEEAPPYPPP